MSLNSRLARLDKALPGAAICRFCGGEHVPTVADLVRVYHEGRKTCACAMCQACRWVRDVAAEMEERKERGNDQD